MFKIMSFLFICTCLYVIWGEIKKAYKKKKAEDVLMEARTESEELSILEEAKKLEEENRQRKEALFSKEEVSEEEYDNPPF